jgi:hypothetical protein
MLPAHSAVHPENVILLFLACADSYPPTRRGFLGTSGKKLHIQGTQIRRNEAHLLVRRSDEGCSATQKLDFLRSRQHHSLIFIKELQWQNK